MAVDLYGPGGVRDSEVWGLIVALQAQIDAGLAGGATDAELAAAVDGLDTALAGKQATIPPGTYVAVADPLRPVVADAAAVAVAGMADTNVTDTSAVCVLGILGDDLYLLCSQNDPSGGGPAAGTLAGVWHYRDGAWTWLGKAYREAVSAVHNYNRLEEWGAVAYKGKLYIGDRHTGKLYRLDLNLDGSLYRVTVVGQVGNEDIFPGPPFAGRLPLGTFGAIGMPADYPGLFTYDGTAVANIFLSPAIGNLGWVTSMALHGGYLWAHLRNVAGTYFELWRVDTAWVAVMVWSGTTNHKLVGTGTSLVAIEWRDAAPISDARWVVWRSGAWQAISAGIGAVGDGSANPPDIRAAWTMGGRLYAASYYYGVFEFDHQGVSRLSAAPPRVQSIAVQGDTVWLMGTNPTALYRMPSRQPALTPSVTAAVPGSASVSSTPPTVAALPIASVGNRGRVVLLLGDGVTTADLAYQCRRSAAGIYEWVPLSVGASVIPLPADPVFHYRADAITGLADAAAVTSWVDSSAGATPVTQVTGTKRPTYRTAVLNGKPVVRFDGVDDFLQVTTGAAHIQPMTTVLVAKLASVAALKYLMDGGTGINMHVAYGGAGPWGMVAASQFTGVGPTSNTAWHILVCVFNETQSRLRVDGGAGVGGTVSAQTRIGLTLGAAQTGILPAPMDLAEAVSFDRVLSVDEINAVGTSLAAKYGLAWTTAT